MGTFITLLKYELSSDIFSGYWSENLFYEHTPDECFSKGEFPCKNIDLSLHY